MSATRRVGVVGYLVRRFTEDSSSAVYRIPLNMSPPVPLRNPGVGRCWECQGMNLASPDTVRLAAHSRQTRTDVVDVSVTKYSAPKRPHLPITQ